MRYNAIGNLGAGAGLLSIDQHLLGVGGNWAWRDQDRLVANAQGPDGIFRLYQYARSNWLQPTLLDPRGASAAGGGGGNWIATLQSRPKQTYGEIAGAPMNPILAGCTILDGNDPDGRLLFASPDFQSLIVVAADGLSSVIWPTGAHVNLSSARLIPDGLVYMDMATTPARLMIQLGNVPPIAAPTLDTPFDPTSFVSGGQRWLLYHNLATYLHPIATTQGYRFPASYGPDVFVYPDGSARVATTSSAGEFPQDIHIFPLTLGQGMGPLLGVPGPVVLPRFARFARRTAVGPFFATSRQYGDLDAPGNFEILVADSHGAVPWAELRHPRPVIADLACIDSVPPAMRLGLWCAATAEIALVDQIRRLRPEAQRRGLGLCVYLDRRHGWTFEILQLLRAGDVCLPQQYRDRFEAIGAFEADIQAVGDDLVARGWPVLGIAGWSDRGWFSDAELLEEMPVWDRQCRRDGRLGMAEFAYGRPTGLISHPLERPYAEAFADASDGLPDWPKPHAAPIVIHSPAPIDPPPATSQEEPMLADLRPTSIVKKFLAGYTKVQEVPSPDEHKLVGLQRADGKFASFTEDGDPNPNVDPPGWAPTNGALERFNISGGAYIHDKSGMAIPRAVEPADLP